jgi:hypothetical protein
MPQIGDLLLTTCRQSEYNRACTCLSKGEKHVGIVREIGRDGSGYQSHVRILWSTNEPINYRDKFGYIPSNIHNLRSEFTIIRDGNIIP